MKHEPNNGTNSNAASQIHAEMLAKFHSHGFRGPCAECGMVPYSSMTVSEWVAHHMADRIIQLSSK